LGPIETIEKYNSTITELGNRFYEEVEGLSNVSRELTSFIVHLYDKIKVSFERMVTVG
jgi:hypothetical protein